MSVKLFGFLFSISLSKILHWDDFVVFCELLFLYIGGEDFQSFGSKGWELFKTNMAISGFQTIESHSVKVM